MADLLTISSYNLHGFGNGKFFLKDLCSFSDVICIQEHWLLPSSLNCINNFSENFVGFSTSAMDVVSGSGILRGRPYGGVGILVSKRYASLVKCLAKAERYIVISIGNILVVSVYFPVFKDCDNYQNNMLDILSDLGSVLEQYPNYNTVVTGDFNCDLASNNNACKLLSQFMIEHGLMNCDKWCVDFDKYTYYHVTLGSKSFIDHFLVSKDIESAVSSFDIINNGANLSDHLPIVLKVTLTENLVKSFIKPCVKKTVSRPCKLRWDKANIEQYYIDTYFNLKRYSLNCFTRNVDSQLICTDSNKIDELLAYIVDGLTRAADANVPKTTGHFYKHWWNDNLTDLKEKSIAAHQLWKNCGSPQSGDIYHLKRKAKSEYKSALRQVDRSEIDSVSNDLNDCLLQKDQFAFWKTWGSKFGNKIRTAEFIDGSNNHEIIANKFAAVFETACSCNSTDTNERLRAEFESCKRDYTASSGDCASELILSVDIIIKCIKNLKLQKAAGLDGIEAEHIVYCHPIVVDLLYVLFNSILFHEYVPRDFCKGVIIPLVKDRNDDVTSSSNYRAITLSSNIAKLFEMCLLEIYGHYLTTSDLQFGFKKNSGCNSAIYTVKCVIDFYTKHGSTVNVCLLDMTKAFDKVNHYCLYLKLMKKKVPLKLLNILINWYSKCFATVCWNATFSNFFRLICGVRQGGVLSPIFFAIYVDDMIVGLKDNQAGCFIGGLYVGCVMYADDLLLISASLDTLQRMIDICVVEALYLDMIFNVKKSMVIRFGPRFQRDCISVTLNGLDLPYVNKARYLGVFISSCRRFRISLDEPIVNFFKSVNGILSKCKGRMNEMVLLHLFNAYCKPLLCYGCECTLLLKSEYSRLLHAWNTIFWKLFKVNDSDCINDITWYSGSVPLLISIDARRFSFLHKLSSSENTVLNSLYFMFAKIELNQLISEYNLLDDCTPHQFKGIVCVNAQLTD